MVSHGITNSRMKDFFDVWVLCREFSFDGASLAPAIHATFVRRGTAFPDGVPVGLSEAFSGDAAKATQWKAFVRKSRIEAPPLDEILPILRDFLMPPMSAARDGTGFASSWPPGGPWTG